MNIRFFLGSLLVASAMALTISCDKEEKDSPIDELLLVASPTSVDFAWKSPDPQTILVATNSPSGFTIGKTADWYSVSVNGRKVTFNVQTNNGPARTHELVITAEGTADLIITVNQEEGGKAREVVYNFTTPGPFDIGWPTANFTSEFTDNITAGDGWGKIGGHFYAGLDGVGTQDKTLPVYKDIYGKAFDKDGNEVDWLYNIGFTDNNDGPYKDGTGSEFKIYIAYKANTTGAPRFATIKLYFEDTEAFKVVGTYDREGNLQPITCKDPIFTCDVTQPAE